jgi:hypothetical protein
MTSGENLLNSFYSSFQKKDFAGMQASYSDNAVFNDEVFTNLNGEEVRAMWEMLIKGGKDLEIVFEDVSADDQRGTARWTASYTFSRSGNKVINHVNSEFVFENGKIIQHTDRFDFYKWSRQALGLPGLLLGWTTFLKKKTGTMAMQRLRDFMDHKKTQKA